jgi:hypothetical protein
MYTPNYNWGYGYMPSQPGFNMYFGNTYNIYNYYDPWAYNNGWNYYGYNPYYYNNYYWGMGNPYWGNSYWNGYYNGYYNGYNNGWYNGYYNGYNSGYYNSYDYNSVYYGPRKSRTGSNGNEGPGDGKMLTAAKPVKEEIHMSDPTNPQRFNYIPINPKLSEGSNAPVKGGNYNTPHTINNAPSSSEPRPVMTQPRNAENPATQPTKNNPVKTDSPREWNWGNQNNSGGENNPGRPPIKFDNEPRNAGGGFENQGNQNKSGNNGGGITRPRK